MSSSASASQPATSSSAAAAAAPEQTILPRGLTTGPPGTPFNPALFKAVLAAIKFRHQIVAPPTEHVDKVAFAVLHGYNGLRISSSLESETDILKFTNGARKGFETFEAAQAWVDLWGWHALPRRIKALRTELIDVCEDFGSIASRAEFANKDHFIKLADTQAPPPEFTVSVKALKTLVNADTPDSLVAIVANHRVEFSFNRTDTPHNPLTVFSNKEGNVPAGPPKIPFTTYTRTSSGQYIDVELGADDQTLERVVPTSLMYVADLKPVKDPKPRIPLAPLPRRDRGDTTMYYWAIVQGREVGIFYDSIAGIADIIPKNVSTARGCNTLEEASQWWYAQLDAGVPLTRIVDASSADQVFFEQLERAKDAGDTVAIDLAANVLL